MAAVWTTVCKGTGGQADGLESQYGGLGQRRWLGLRGDTSQHRRTQVEVTGRGPASDTDVGEAGLGHDSSSV